jgi:tetratricopeptide (TPR) repeat protein
VPEVSEPGGAESRMSRDELIAAVAGRTEDCFRNGPEAVLGPGALDEARQLAELIGSRDASDAVAVMLLATFHMHRWRALPEGEDAWDAEQMKGWLTIAGTIDPRLVPPPLRGMLAQHAPAGTGPDAGELNAEAAALVFRFGQTGTAGLLDRGIALWQQGLGQLRPDQPAPRATILSNLSGALAMRSEISHSQDDADKAVAAATEAARISPPGHEIHGSALGHLAVALKNRYELRGDQADLKEAIAAGRDAVAEEYRMYPARPRFLTNLGDALRLSFESHGRLSDLDEAIALNREAVAGAGSDDAVTIQANLGGILQLRFEETAERTDLDEAVAIGRATVEATPPGHPQLAGRLSSLSGALQTRAVFLAQSDDLTEAVEVARRAVAATTDTHPERAMCLSNLAAALRAQFTLSPLWGRAPDPVQQERDLADMVQAARAALQATPAGHPQRAGQLNNLGVLLRLRGSPEDLDEAVDAAREAVAITPGAHHNWCPHMSNLGNALEARFLRTRRPEDLRDAISAWGQAAVSPTGASQVRLAAAIAWGRRAGAEIDAASAAEGFAVGVSLLPLVAWRGLERAVREQNLARWRGLASDAAAWAIRDHQPDLAVELLEQGRSVLWAQQLHMQADVDKLAGLDADLKKALEETRRALDFPEARRGIAERKAPLDPELEAATHRRNAERWDALVAQVREIPGFEDFLAAVPFRKLCAAAAGGPVVIVNTSSYGCDALVVDNDGVRVIPLPALGYDEITSQVNNMLAALDMAAGGEVDAPAEALAGILGWLWAAVARPVLDALNLNERPDLTGQDAALGHRLWWCPTGVLSLLPVHAAGLYGPEHAAVPERVISSYTATLGALIRAREPRAELARGQLLVGVPDAPGAPLLRSVPAEIRRIQACLPDASTLESEFATRNRVLASMAEHDWVHLACHGRQDLADPSASSVLLSDGPLPIRQIASRLLAGSDLAFLSACQTFTGSPQLSDEAIHLASAFQVAGYRHVIATLWSIYDRLAPQVASDVYQTLNQGEVPDSTRAAEAIHLAVARLRARNPGRPQIWAPYVHIGP